MRRFRQIETPIEISKKGLPVNVVICADHVIGYRIVHELTAMNLNDTTISAVFTNPRTPRQWWPSLLDSKNNLPFPVRTYDSEAQWRKHLAAFAPDWVLLLSWKHLVRPPALEIPRHGYINLHYSLLPRHRGTHPVNWSIIEGDRVAGITYHLVGPEIDRGRILLQKQLDIRAYDTARTLLERLDDLALDAFRELWRQRFKWSTMETAPTQEESFHFKRDFEATNELNLDKIATVREVINLLRGKTFEPYARQLYFRDERGEKIYLSLNISPETFTNSNRDGDRANE